MAMLIAIHVNIAILVLICFVQLTKEQPLVPAVFIFGDSVVDVGNNNQLYTLVKSNFPPYGRDFNNHEPTGRFCNGKLATDFTVENLGFTTYPPAYLSPQAAGNNLLQGANFASGASGFLPSTAKLYRAITLTQQLQYFKDYQSKLQTIAQRANANFTDIISGSIYIISTGSSDYVQNYYINPLFYERYTPDQFADLLVESFTAFAQNLYSLGVRKIGVTSLPPIGCLPAVITLFGNASNACVTHLNNDVVSFNKKLETASYGLKSAHSDLKIVVFDIYNPLLDLVQNPGNSGFFEARKACCGTGIIEISMLCNKRSRGTCANASGYVFWDSVHPSEAANKVLSDALLVQGIDLIS